MKGLTGSAGAMAVIALGLFPSSNGESLRQDGSDHGQTGGVDAAGSLSTNTLDTNGSRRLQRRNRPVTDDALDVNGTVGTDTLMMCRVFPTTLGTHTFLVIICPRYCKTWPSTNRYYLLDKTPSTRFATIPGRH